MTFVFDKEEMEEFDEIGLIRYHNIKDDLYYKIEKTDSLMIVNTRDYILYFIIAPILEFELEKFPKKLIPEDQKLIMTFHIDSGAYFIRKDINKLFDETYNEESCVRKANKILTKIKDNRELEKKLFEELLEIPYL